MAGSPFTCGFVKVQGGWTGALALTVGSTTVTATPTSFAGSGRTSAAEVVLRAVELAADSLGGTWTAFPSTDGRIHINSSLTFSLAISGNTATRTGLSNASSVSTTNGSTHPDGAYPLAVDYRGVPLQRSRGAHTVGGDAALPLTWASARQTIRIMETWANAHTFSAALFPEGALNCYDLWITDRILGRFKITGAALKPASRNNAYWDVDFEAIVSE